jgi:hypothetical protein
MGIAIREGLLEKHYEKNEHPLFGKRSFTEFATVFAGAYNA